jgi:hypothetical protein
MRISFALPEIKAVPPGSRQVDVLVQVVAANVAKFVGKSGLGM